MITQAVTNPSEERIDLGELAIRFLLTGEDTNGSVSVFEMEVPGGTRLRAPTHWNDSYEETIYGIEGVLTWTIDGQPVEVGLGEAVCIRRGVSHRFDNFDTEAARQLVVTSPAIMGPDYFREVIDLVRAAAGGPPDMAQFVALFKRHGMTLAPAK
jgi:quercetin dioxygenase-like cupin family protein